VWRQRFLEWFRLAERGNDLVCGDVEFGFQEGPHPRVRLSLRFLVPADGGVIPISGGQIELVESS
jgi:hypothetical protein